MSSPVPSPSLMPSTMSATAAGNLTTVEDQAGWTWEMPDDFSDLLVEEQVLDLIDLVSDNPDYGGFVPPELEERLLNEKQYSRQSYGLLIELLESPSPRETLGMYQEMLGLAMEEEEEEEEEFDMEEVPEAVPSSADVRSGVYAGSFEHRGSVVEIYQILSPGRMDDGSVTPPYGYSPPASPPSSQPNTPDPWTRDHD